MPIPKIKQTTGPGQPTPPPSGRPDDYDPALVVLGVALFSIGLYLGYQALDMLNNHGTLSEVDAVIVFIFFVVTAAVLSGGIVVLAIQGAKWRAHRR